MSGYKNETGAFKDFPPSQQKGMWIASQGGWIREIAEEKFQVRSQTKNRWYTIRQIKGFWACTCEHFAMGHKCKHVYALEFYLANKKQTYKEQTPLPKKRTYHRDWSAYNAAQVNEWPQLLRHLRDIVTYDVQEPVYVRGRPPLGLKDEVAMAILKVYGVKCSRRDNSALNEPMREGVISAKVKPHFNAVSKFWNRSDAFPTLYHVLECTASPLRDIETSLSVDSTGFRLGSSSFWGPDKHGYVNERSYLKAHLITGDKTHIIAGAIITDERGADTAQFAPLVERANELGFAPLQIEADKIYNSRANIMEVVKVGAVPYIPFRSNQTGRPMGAGPIYRKMWNLFQHNPDIFEEHYHRRSNIESTIASLKRKFGEANRSRNPVALVNETLSKLIAYNITVLIH